MPFCNTTLEDEPVSRVDLSIGITFHHLGLILSAAAGLIAVLIAGFMIFRHALHYSRPGEQKHIIRILFMIPVYAVVSFLSYFNYHHAVYFEVIRDCYEAFAIAGFFTLLCNYIAPSLHDQKDYFRSLKPKNWLWPMTWLQKCTGGQEKGIFRRPMSGLTWFNVIYLLIFQYCFIRVLFTIVAVSSQAAGRYCSASLSPAFAHIWVMAFEGVSVALAMYALIQFYFQTKEELKEKRPFMKLLCIKLVIFFCFWQTLVIDFLSSSHGPLHTTPKLAYPDIQVGIPSMLICLEMAIFATLHIFAFSAKPYKIPHNNSSNSTADQLYAKPTNTSYNNSGAHQAGLGLGSPKYRGGPFGIYAFIDAFNPWDILKATARGFKWLFIGSRNRRTDPSYAAQGHLDSESGWNSGSAFDGPDVYDKNAAGGAYAPSPTGLQNFSRPGVGGLAKYGNRGGSSAAPRDLPRGPHQGRPGASRMQSHVTDADEDEDVWASGDFDDEMDHGRGRGHRDRARDSFEVGAEDRAGLLRSSAGMGMGSAARIGVSPNPGRSEGQSQERSERHHGSERPGRGRRQPAAGGGGGEMSAFDKEAGIESQYVGYGRNSWGRDQRPGG